MDTKYLSDIPVECSEWGAAKVLLVRKESIHLKHIWTEVFVRRSVDIESLMDRIGRDVMWYMEYMINRMRRVYKFPRYFNIRPDFVVKHRRERFFPTIELYRDLHNCIVLDFDGVTNKPAFRKLYSLCVQREKTVICTANPTVNWGWFERHEYEPPETIYARRGKRAKIIQLCEIAQRHDFTFYVDDEIEYLTYAWLLGIQTYHYINHKIQYFTLNS